MPSARSKLSRRKKSTGCGRGTWCAQTLCRRCIRSVHGPITSDCCVLQSSTKGQKLKPFIYIKGREPVSQTGRRSSSGVRWTGRAQSRRSGYTCGCVATSAYLCHSLPLAWWPRRGTKTRPASERTVQRGQRVIRRAREKRNGGVRARMRQCAQAARSGRAAEGALSDGPGYVISFLASSWRPEVMGT